MRSVVRAWPVLMVRNCLHTFKKSLFEDLKTPTFNGFSSYDHLLSAGHAGEILTTKYLNFHDKGLDWFNCNHCTQKAFQGRPHFLTTQWASSLDIWVKEELKNLMLKHKWQQCGTFSELAIGSYTVLVFDSEPEMEDSGYDQVPALERTVEVIGGIITSTSSSTSAATG